MDHTFINLTEENLMQEHLCCIIRMKKAHPGVEAKRMWLHDRLKEGHVFRKLNAKATVFIEYAPLEKAWVPIVGKNYYYIYCLWVLGDFKGKGYGKELLEYVINDARENGLSGICMLGSKKQKAWLSDQSFVKKYGFEVVDTTENGYELLALSFDGTTPQFTELAKRATIAEQDLVIYYDLQCPYIYQTVETIKSYCQTHHIPAFFRKITSLKQAKEVPSAFNNFCVFYHGNMETVNLLSIDNIKKIVQRKDNTK